jgi:hypothetical protein
VSALPAAAPALVVSRKAVATMQFSSRETRLIEKLRKRERQWPRTRWLVLAMGLLSAVVAALWAYLVAFRFAGLGPGHPDSREVVAIAFVVTKCCLMFLFAAWCFAVAFRDWHGNAHRLLLLRLLDARLQEANSDVQEG